jgi:SEC-C motif
MLNILTEPRSTSTASERDTDELLHNLGRFPSPVLPTGLLRELQSRGDSIHDSLVAVVGKAVNMLGNGLGSQSETSFFAFALLVPIATCDDRPLIESLLTLPDRSINAVIGDLANEAMPHVIANFFKEQSASELIDWIERLADLPERQAYPLFRAMTLAVARGQLDRTTAIEALVNRLKKRADLHYDLQSAQVVCELMNLSASNLEAVDAVVRASFGRGQIDANYVTIGDWDEIDSESNDDKTWNDPAENLSTWCYDFVSDDLDPVNATFQVNGWAGRSSHLKVPSISDLIDKLRQSTDSNFPRDAVRSIDQAFADVYHATVDLIREEVVRYQSDSDTWCGNGAYLGLVLTVANKMPLPVDLLEAILRMPQTDREQIFGDQFGLIVQTVALTPLPQYDFIEQWIWNADRSNADRREMVNAYSSLCYNGFLDREVAISTLVAGLRRAMLEEPMLITSYAENLAFLAPKAHSQLLDEAFQRDDVEWFVPLPDLRRMVQDAKFAEAKFREHDRSYRIVSQVISEGVMFDRDVLQEKPRQTPARVIQPQPQPKVSSATTIRNDVRAPRNALCPCGSGKKFKKCCLNK